MVFDISQVDIHTPDVRDEMRMGSGIDGKTINLNIGLFKGKLEHIVCIQLLRYLKF